VAWNGSGTAQPKGPKNPAQPADSPYNGTPMLYARLNDTGTAFEPQRNLMQHTFALDGGGSIAADAQGNVYVAWHGGEGSGKGEQDRRLWVARSRDDGKTFAREAPAAAEPTGACACCGTRSFVDRDGTLYILYRAAFTPSDRDMYLLVSRDRGASFQGARIHPWKIAACPMSSESFAQGSGSVTGAWETAGQVYFARLDPAKAGIAAPIAAPGEGATRKHPALATNARGETILVWSEGTAWQKGGALAWQVFDQSGRPTAEKGKIEGGIPTWSLPAVYARPDGGFTIAH
jgi:hypothetical protein